LVSEREKRMIDDTGFKYRELNNEPLLLTNDECNYDSNITVD
jgi:hypothetical protein